MANKLATWALFITFSTDWTSLRRPWSFKLNRCPAIIIQSALTIDKLVLKHKSMATPLSNAAHNSRVSPKMADSILDLAKPSHLKWRMVNFLCSSHSRPVDKITPLWLPSCQKKPLADLIWFPSDNRVCGKKIFEILLGIRSEIREKASWWV